jgi:hypothetical protein
VRVKIDAAIAGKREYTLYFDEIASSEIFFIGSRKILIHLGL